MAVTSPSTAPSAEAVTGESRRPKSALRTALYRIIGWLLETIIELLVRIAGRRIRLAEAPWLKCPMGDSVLIGTGIYERIARDENLELRFAPDSGLIADFATLRGPTFDPDLVPPRVRYFYEHAGQYQLEAWSDVALVGKFFLWLLVEFISQRMDQLNFPISPLEMAGGGDKAMKQFNTPSTRPTGYM